MWQGRAFPKNVLDYPLKCGREKRTVPFNALSKLKNRRKDFYSADSLKSKLKCGGVVARHIHGALRGQL